MVVMEKRPDFAYELDIRHVGVPPCVTWADAASQELRSLSVTFLAGHHASRAAAEDVPAKRTQVAWADYVDSALGVEDIR